MKEFMPVYDKPQLLRRYQDKTIRIVYNQDLKVGDTISFKNERWNDEWVIIKAIKENRKSKVDFGNFEKAKSYQLAVETTVAPVTTSPTT